MGASIAAGDQFGQQGSAQVRAAIAATVAALLIFFWHDIPPAYEVEGLAHPASGIRDRATFIAGWIVLGLLLVGFFALEPMGVPVSAVAAVGAVVLLVVAGRGSVISTTKVLREAPWHRDLLHRHVSGGLWAAKCGAG